MTTDQLLSAAREAGFKDPAIIPTHAIVFDPSFRPYCGENRCGQYGANYSCPPECGSPEEMRERILAFDRAMVLRSTWDIDGYQDYETIRKAKRSHNETMLRLCDGLRSEGTACLMGGASQCILCEKCTLPAGEPCRFPEKRFSCLSAYCIHVAKLAEAAGMDFSWSDRKMSLYGLIAF